MATRNPLKEIYCMLGRVLNRPAAFGLGDRAPKRLVEILTISRRRLMEELVEQKCSRELDELSLEAELSQDTDTHSFPASKAS